MVCYVDVHLARSLTDHRYCLVAGSLEELIKHGLRALRDTLPNETDLNTKVRR